MEISIIVSFYKNIKALELIFKAFEKQTFRDFEVIVSEDDNNSDTVNFIAGQRLLYNFNIKHLNQEVDNGFRKNQMLNRSVQSSEGEIIVFIDGDCIPHKKFVKAYINNIRPNILCFGRRVMLDKNTTESLYKNKDIGSLNFLRLLKTKTSRLKYAIYFPVLKKIRKKGIWGCNYGLLKRHLLEINGFDEDYITAGVGEDVDIEWRLAALGVKFRSIRHEALQFHLYHKENYASDAINIGMEQLREKRSQQLFYCKNGLNKT